MGKIIHFESRATQLENWVNDCFNTIKDKDYNKALIIARNPQGDFVSGYFNMDLSDKNEAVGHIQADIMDSFLKENINNYIGYIGD